MPDAASAGNAICVTPPYIEACSIVFPSKVLIDRLPSADVETANIPVAGFGYRLKVLSPFSGSAGLLRNMDIVLNTEATHTPFVLL